MKWFITANGDKYSNTDSQVRFCKDLLKVLPRKKGHYYELRFIYGILQLIDTYKGIETIYESPLTNTTFGEYREFFENKLR